jgi:nucleotide-binding universal stress UspA family protein
LAARFGASLDVLHVVPNPYVAESFTMYAGVVPDFVDGLVKETTVRLNEVLPTSERTRLRARCLVKVGDPRTEILDYVRAEHVDLLVMGTHGRTGMAHLFLGSVAERMVRTAPCPVLTVR